jgi:SAM-dependent methyltransferase
MNTLPDFNENESNDKNRPLTAEEVDGYSLNPLLADFLQQAGQREKSARILDFGCGRGTAVAKLRSLGWDARGVDIDASYIANGIALLGERDQRGPILSVVDSAGRAPFAAGSFDILLTDQVLEHVPDLRAVIAEIRRLTAPGGLGIHIFPARLGLLEQHLKLPLVQWAPTNQLRRLLIRWELATGLGAPYFREFSLAQRTQIFAHFVETETFNPSSATVIGLFREHGLNAAIGTPRKFRIRPGIVGRLAKLPGVARVGGYLYDTFWASCVITWDPTRARPWSRRAPHPTPR